MRRSVVLVSILVLPWLLWAGNEPVTVKVEESAVAVETNQALTGDVDAITIPHLISYQGRLTDTLGVPVPDGNYSLTFRLYHQETGGTPFWSETQTVAVKNGLFSVLLGAVTPIPSVPDAGVLYLSLQVETGSELTPRLRLVSAPYAYLAERSGDAEALQGKDTSALDARYVNEGQANAITSAMIQNNAVNSAKIADNSVASADILDGTIATADIANSAVNSAKVADGTIIRADVAADFKAPYADTADYARIAPAVDSARVSANSHRLQGKDTSALDLRYVNEGQANAITRPMIQDGAVNSAKIQDGTIASADLSQMGATTGQVLKWTGSAWAPGNDSVGYGDNAWVRGTPDSVLFTIRQLGIARGGADNMLYGTNRFTHINLGVACTTGTSAQDYAYCTVGGGFRNTASGSRATVGGGIYNTASGWYATVAGGDGNRASGDYATVAGGDINTASGWYATVGGGYADTASGYMATVGGGRSNIASHRYATVAGGDSNKASGWYATVGGGDRNTASSSRATVGGGYVNTASGVHATVGGGYADTASGSYATVGGGFANTASDTCATVGGGRSNTASGNRATVGGGDSNKASGWYATVSGGYRNTASGRSATVAGGYRNIASDWYATVAGGRSNTASGEDATVGGGYADTASGGYATVGGGYRNIALGWYATVGGGYENTASGGYATVAGGDSNIASGNRATVGGGRSNTASNYYATVAGGRYNTASGSEATVAGGEYNTASGAAATVAGGAYNTASSGEATVGGGLENTASGFAATVAGGRADTSAGDYSFTVGEHSVVPSSYSNSAAFNGQTATASNQLRCGALSKASGSFTIDHPLDPYGKILNHYFIEGPEMRNIYEGSVVLDASGKAEVHLPEYFSALNRNPHIQLTGVGTSEVYVLEDVNGNRFVIGGKPGTKVYWQVTGERQDVSAEVTRRMMPVEQKKTGALAGRMLDDEFLSGCMEQLEREGKSQGIDFRTAGGRQRYLEMKRHLEENKRK